MQNLPSRALAVIGAVIAVVALFLGWFEYTLKLFGDAFTGDAFTAWEIFSGRDIALATLAGASVLLAGLSAVSTHRLIAPLVALAGMAGLVIAVIAVVSPPTPGDAQTPDIRGAGLDAKLLFGAYLAIGGFLAIAIGGLWVFVSRMALSNHKQCPDCAKRVPAEARACRFCGYRFNDASVARAHSDS